MSIKLNNGTILRNLEEQVQYLTNYHDVNQGLVQWGIRVVGQVDSENELPDPATYKGEYGDAIAVGTKAPYFFYIWTRASIEGNPAYWFPFGEISIIGPEGPVGPQGPKGDIGESTKIIPFSGVAAPPSVSDSNVGDYALNTQNGDMYQLVESPDNLKYWKFVINIKGPQGIQGVQGQTGSTGPQGPQGPKGDTGDVGGFINIYGIVANVGQLPTPSDLKDLTAAYLVGTASPYNLYIQVGSTSASAVWRDMGPLNVATYVTVNGQYQNVWDADTKVSKVYNNYQDKYKVYISGPNNTGDTTLIAGYNPIPGQMPIFGSSSSTGQVEESGTIGVATPEYPYAAANKKYVDDSIAAAITNTLNTEV